MKGVSYTNSFFLDDTLISAQGAPMGILLDPEGTSTGFHELKH